MGMYLRNNERRTPAEIKHHLCFICGDMFHDRHAYQKHLIDHQTFALLYQIYHFDKTERERMANEKSQKTDSKPGRVGHSRSEDAGRSGESASFRQSEELERDMRSRAKNRSRGVDKLEKLHREERKQYMREREREEEQQAERERLRKVEAARKRREIRKRKLDERTAMAAMKDQAIPILKRKPTARDKDVDTTSLISSRVKDEPLPLPTKPPLPPQLSLVRKTSTGYSIGPLNSEKCPYCVKQPFSNPVDVVEHIVDHGGSILDVQLSFYNDDQFLATETQLAGEKCNACEVNFDFPTQYYLHLLIKHRMDVTAFYRDNYPEANNVKFTTILIFRMFPEHKVEFREIIPSVLLEIKH